MIIKAVQADITKLDNVDAIFNAAKNSLLGGGGVVCRIQPRQPGSICGRNL